MKDENGNGDGRNQGKSVTAIMVIAAVAVVGWSAAIASTAPNTHAAGGRDAAWVAQRVKEWQATEFENRWQTIGWADSILYAERLAKDRKRPVFLFTHDGRLNVGRC